MKIDYKLVRSSNRKTLSIRIEQYTAKVIVSAPINMSLARISEFVQSKSSWIITRINKVNKNNQLLPKILSGEKIYFAGKNYILNICGCKKPSVTGQFINLRENNAKGDLELIAKKLFIFYAQEKTALLAKQFGFNYNSVAVGKASTKWGSCSPKREIIYSVALSFVPDDISDYVVLHELCHTKQMNHGKNFYSLLKSCLPDYKEKEKRLKNYSSFLHFLKDKNIE